MFSWFAPFVVMGPKSHRESLRSNLRRYSAFTLVELLVVIAIVGILMALLLPSLTRTQARAKGMLCFNNVRQLTLAWLMYAHEQRDRLPYNLGGDADRRTVAPKDPLNWVNGIMSWELDSDNTNQSLIVESSLAGYCHNNVKLYKCPSDSALSDVQRDARWAGRTRSYSMNAMVGNAGNLSATGTNSNNPHYRQFFALTEIPKPASIFVFLDEHPDSINDGYFLVKPDYANMEWMDLPASSHNDSAAISFADGHVELHKWTEPETLAAPQPDAAALPRSIPSTGRSDFKWLLHRSSIPQ